MYVNNMRVLEGKLNRERKLGSFIGNSRFISHHFKNLSW